jgi:TPR repeat protein
MTEYDERSNAMSNGDPKPPPNWPNLLRANQNVALEACKHESPLRLELEEIAAALYLGYGHLVEKNIEKAVVVLSFGAAKGNRYCQFTLGELYRNGLGVEKDLEKARQLYRQAAAGAEIASEAAERLKAIETDH